MIIFWKWYTSMCLINYAWNIEKLRECFLFHSNIIIISFSWLELLLKSTIHTSYERKKKKNLQMKTLTWNWNTGVLIHHYQICCYIVTATLDYSQVSHIMYHICHDRTCFYYVSAIHNKISKVFMYLLSTVNFMEVKLLPYTGINCTPNMWVGKSRESVV